MKKTSKVITLATGFMLLGAISVNAQTEKKLQQQLKQARQKKQPVRKLRKKPHQKKL